MEAIQSLCFMVRSSPMSVRASPFVPWGRGTGGEAMKARGCCSVRGGGRGALAETVMETSACTTHCGQAMAKS